MKKFNLDIPRIGYVVAVKKDRKGFISNMIYKSQRKAGFNEDDSSYIHVAMSSGGPHMVNIIPPRSKLINLQKKYKGSYIKILRLDSKSYEEKKRYKVALFYNALASNLKYDVKGAISFVFSWVKHSKRDYFCSEACTKAFQMIYPDFLKGIKPAKSFPAHFVRDLDLVWEGYIK